MESMESTEAVETIASQTKLPPKEEKTNAVTNNKTNDEIARMVGTN